MQNTIRVSQMEQTSIKENMSSIIRTRLNDFHNIPFTQEDVDFAIPLKKILKIFRNNYQFNIIFLHEYQ